MTGVQVRPARKAVKQSRWLLLRNRENLKDGQAVQLQQPLAANQPLFAQGRPERCLVRTQRAGGLAALSNMAAICSRERPALLQRFARNLRKYARGILASAHFPVHSSVLEGVNNRIKVIKRRRPRKSRWPPLRVQTHVSSSFA